MYRKWYNNVLESSFILNLAILALASYQVKVEGGNQAAVAYTSVSVAFATFICIIMYHVTERIVESRTWRIHARPTLQRFCNSLTHRCNHQGAIEMVAPPTATPPPVTTTFIECVNLCLSHKTNINIYMNNIQYTFVCLYSIL